MILQPDSKTMARIRRRPGQRERHAQTPEEREEHRRRAEERRKQYARDVRAGRRRGH